MDEFAMLRHIERKREGGELSTQDWHAVIEGFMTEKVDEAQMAALCMACVHHGMSFEEAHALTAAMIRSGEVLNFDAATGIVVDKHSTGGVGDIVSIAAVPIAAAAGAKIAKLSGRSLGHTGGTIDKLEAIPGFTTSLSIERFERNVHRVGCAIAAQTETLVPADKRLYALRDRTGTISALGLIASSIVSKKVAGGAHAFVFDVKTGSAAFTRELTQALELSRWLVDIARCFDKRATAFVTDMHQPLGRSIGTGIELIEARDLLRGDADPRALEAVLAIAGAIAAEALVDEAEKRVRQALEDGSAYRKFIEMVEAQDGDVAAMERMDLGERFAITSPASGFVGSLDVVELGHAGRRLSKRDSMGGLQVAVRIGDYVERGAPLLYSYGSDREGAAELSAAFHIVDDSVESPPLIYDVKTA